MPRNCATRLAELLMCVWAASEFATPARADESPQVVPGTLTPEADPEPAPAAPSQPVVGGGYLDLNGYYDTRDAMGLTINALATLGHGVSYFSFVDYENKFKPKELGDTNNYYTEQNVMWGPLSQAPIDLHLQWALGDGQHYDLEDALRGGLRLRANHISGVGTWLDRIGAWFQLTWFPYVQGLSFEPVQTWQSQLSAYYRIDFKDRVYASGFLDCDFSAGRSKGAYLGTLTEHQLGLRLIGGLYAVAELRYLYVDLPEHFGVGLGVEWMMRFQTLGAPR